MEREIERAGTSERSYDLVSLPEMAKPLSFFYTMAS